MAEKGGAEAYDGGEGAELGIGDGGIWTELG